MDPSREVVLLCKWTGWSLAEVLDMPIGEFWDWLSHARAVDDEIGEAINNAGSRS